MTKEQEKNDELFPKLSRNTLILRRNLMTSSALVLVVLLFGLELDASSILGIQITGLTKEKTYFVALILLFYFTANFAWSAWNEWAERWLQLIGWNVRDDKQPPYEKPPLESLKNKVESSMTTEADAIRTILGQNIISNRMEIMKKKIKAIEWSWRLYSIVEIGLPLAMGGVAMAWLGYLLRDLSFSQ